jgi:hypothetical protein
MNRRSFVKGAVGATALVLAGRDASPVAAQQLQQAVTQHNFSTVPYVRRKQDEVTEFNWDEWGSTLIPYTRTPEIEDLYRLSQPYNSMVFAVTYMVANVMDRDGNKYNLFREYKAFDSLNCHFSISIPDGVTLSESIAQPGEAYLGKCDNDMIDHRTFQVSPYLYGTGPMTIMRGPQRTQWMDLNGRIELEYKALAPALQYHCPGLIENSMYNSEPYWVKGTIDGKEVKGYGVIDTAWGTPGIAWEQSKLFRYLEEVWVVWCNVFEDGSRETGVFMDGVDKFGCGYYNQNGTAFAAGQSKGEIIWTPDEFIQSANFSVGGIPFVFTMDARVAQVPNFLNWASGSVSRVDETRVPKMSFAWLEFLPKR